jgi:hypothetical protein
MSDRRPDVCLAPNSGLVSCGDDGTARDAAYFRKTREARFGKPLEEVVAGRDKSVEGFRKGLEPMRL